MARLKFIKYVKVLAYQTRTENYVEPSTFETNGRTTLEILSFT
jgi:hypothetical protein